MYSQSEFTVIDYIILFFTFHHPFAAVRKPQKRQMEQNNESDVPLKIHRQQPEAPPTDRLEAQRPYQPQPVSDSFVDGAISCHISRPNSHPQFHPVIETFMTSVKGGLPINTQEYDGSDAAKQQPIVCFGVYMSRMDSNIKEALERVEGSGCKYN